MVGEDIMYRRVKKMWFTFSPRDHYVVHKIARKIFERIFF